MKASSDPGLVCPIWKVAIFYDAAQVDFIVATFAVYKLMLLGHFA